LIDLKIWRSATVFVFVTTAFAFAAFINVPRWLRDV